MKISFVSTSDLGHGAGVAAYNTFNDLVGYCAHYGSDIAFRMYVAEKLSDNPLVHEINPAKKIFGKSLVRYFNKLEHIINLYGPQNVYSVREKGLIEHLKYNRTDLIHLHSIHWDRRNFTPRIIKTFSDKPVIWTLHDMWAFTGHCCYSNDCEKWTTGCGGCERLDVFIPLRKDTTAWLMRIKEKMYDVKNLTVVTPSSWLYDLARSSYLFKNIDVRHIPYSVDTNCFRKIDVSGRRHAAFRGKTTIMFACTWLQDPRKGLEYLIQALSRIHDDLGDCVLLMAGEGHIPEELLRLIKVEHYGDVKDREFMNTLYNMSDIMVCPTVMDNLPNVVLEAMSAGVPVIGYDTGGVPDMIDDGVTGYIVPQKNIDIFADKIRTLIRDPGLRAEMSRQAVKSIHRKFTKEEQASRYLDLYHEKSSKKFIIPGKHYPCEMPFRQIYFVPRETQDFRFCPYHKSNAVVFEKMDYTELNRLFNANPEVLRRREAFLRHDFAGAGCKEGCLSLATYNTIGTSYNIDTCNGEGFHSDTLWLSMGPDCNITCRYCLDIPPKEINYRTADPKFMEMAGDFVMNGGNLLLTGGEPLLPKWGFQKVLQKMVESPDKCKFGKIWLQTNGVLLNKEMRQLMIGSPVDIVGVSFDTCRRDMFNFIRRGSQYDQILENVRNFRDEVKAAGKSTPSIVVLCAVLQMTAPYLLETVDFFYSEGFNIDLNNLHEAVFSPVFSKEQGLHNLSIAALEQLHKDVLTIKERYGHTHRIKYAGLQGQVEIIMKYRSENKDYHVNLSGAEDILK